MRSLLVSKYVKSKFNYSDKHSAHDVTGMHHVSLEANARYLNPI